MKGELNLLFESRVYPNKYYYLIILLVIFTTSLNFVSAARLPSVGGDDDNWGTILNAYLNNALGENATSLNVSSGNITLGQKITFALGGIIENVIAGWVVVDSNVSVAGDLNVSGVIYGDGSGLTNVGGISFFNLTASSYDGNVTNGSLSGYEAANNICDSEFSGTHMCTQSEVNSYIARAGASGVTSGEVARVISGGPKYAPADHPVNDCDGLTNSGTDSTDPLGSYWSFDNETGGQGVAGNCALSYPLACCS